MNKKAVFPGTFDPITKGHESVIKRAIPIFDEIIIAIGINPEKKCLFEIEKRIGWIKKVFKDYPSVKVETYSGLTVDFCKASKANYIIRGLRGTTDFEFERSIALMNNKLENGIDTIFFMSMPEFIPINSSIVRNIYQNGGNTSLFVPEGIELNG